MNSSIHVKFRQNILSNTNAFEPVSESLSTNERVKYPLTSDLWLTSIFVSLKRSKKVPGSKSISLLFTSSLEINPYIDLEVQIVQKSHHNPRVLQQPWSKPYFGSKKIEQTSEFNRSSKNLYVSLSGEMTEFIQQIRLSVCHVLQEKSVKNYSITKST